MLSQIEYTELLKHSNIQLVRLIREWERDMVSIAGQSGGPFPQQVCQLREQIEAARCIIGNRYTPCESYIRRPRRGCY